MQILQHLKHHWHLKEMRRFIRMTTSDVKRITNMHCWRAQILACEVKNVATPIATVRV